MLLLQVSCYSPSRLAARASGSLVTQDRQTKKGRTMKQPKVKLTWEQIKVSRKWTKKWKEDPEHMEYIRSTRATPAAKKRHDELNESLIEHIKQLPEKLTLTDLKGWIKGIPYYNKKTGKERNRKSLFNRLIRRKLIRYDATTKKWINLTHATSHDPNLQS